MLVNGCTHDIDQNLDRQREKEEKDKEVTSQIQIKPEQTRYTQNKRKTSEKTHPKTVSSV